MTAEFLKQETERSKAELKQALIEHQNEINKLAECINKGAAPIHLQIPSCSKLNTTFERWEMYTALYKREIARD